MGDWADDYLDKMFDLYEDENGCLPKYKPQPKECHRCGAYPLAWGWKSPGEWRLVDPDTGEVHECPGVSPDDFEVIE